MVARTMKEKNEVSAPRQSVAEARKVGEDWTVIKAHEERKKLQNRLNQRARRRRETTLITKPPSKTSYHVDRWRITDHADPGVVFQAKPRSLSSESALTPQATSGFSVPIQLQAREGIPHNQTPYDSIDPSFAILDCNPTTTFTPTTSTHDLFTRSYTPSVDFPLSSDHLIHLIHHNVLRAILVNKTMLCAATSLIKPNDLVPIIPSTTNVCDGLTLIYPVDQSLPSALRPTALQTTYAHPSWMNTFPCASIRDNLIACAGTYNEMDLLSDIFGDCITNNYVPSSYDQPIESCVESAGQRPMIDNEADSDDVTARRKGLIVWGEPWNVESWEVTPGFVRKWGLLLHGCDQLIAASNYWRALRGEEPLPRVVIEL